MRENGHARYAVVVLLRSREGEPDLPTPTLALASRKGRYQEVDEYPWKFAKSGFFVRPRTICEQVRGRCPTGSSA
jgi:hypothetical protein